jgi:general secretion pathway protein F
MPSYRYTALDLKGLERHGRIEADDQATAKAKLEGKKLWPLKLEAASLLVTDTPKMSVFTPRLSSRDLALMTRQLATLISVAPLEESLRTLSQQTEKPRISKLLSDVQSGVLEGWRLSDSMARQGPHFPKLYTAMIAAGEASGSLEPILNRLADHLEREQEVKAKVTTALVYPAVLAIVAILVIIALMTLVVPKVVEQFSSMNQKLPALTQGIIFVSDVMRYYGGFIIIGLALLSLGFWRAMKILSFKRRIDGAVLKVPLIGRLVRDLHAAHMARTLSTMMASGLPLLDGLRMTARTVNNQVLREATDQMISDISEGSSLSSSMRRTRVFPPLLEYMASSGENAGKLETMLERASDYMEREFKAFTSVLLSLLEPVIIVIMGGLVALIVLSILLPILQINTMVGA